MNKLLGALACLFPMFAAAADYSSTLVVQTGLLVESDLVVRNITDLASKKTCLAFYVRTPGTSSVIDCYDVIGDFGTTVRQVGHIKADEVIITEILPALNDTEEDKQSISTIDMLNSISKLSGRPVKIINDFHKISDYIRENFNHDSVVTTIGAGDIYKVRDIMMSK